MLEAEAPAVHRRSTAVPGSSLAGAALCLLSAAGFGAMGIFGKLAYESGVSTLTLLLVRFSLGASIFWLLLAARSRAGLGLVVRPRRAVGVGLGLGAIGYATQAGLFFAGLARVGPSAASILSTFEPVVTVVLAYLAFSEHLSAVQLGGAALVLSAAVLLAAPARAPARVPPT